MDKTKTGRAKGGVEKAKKLSAEERKELSKKMVDAKAELASLPVAMWGSSDRPLKIGDVELPCYVLSDETRVLTQEGFLAALGRAKKAKGGQGAAGAENEVDRLPSFLSANNLKPFINNELIESTRPIVFRTPSGMKAYGYRAELLPRVCRVYLEARDARVLQASQTHIERAADLLMRGFAEVGIAALIDEATGYQKDRARDALAKILEAYVAKELQPYVRTFDPDYYEHMFRLRGLPYPPDSTTSKPQYRPQYFGKLTNDIVYRRLAPGVLEALKDESKKAEKKGKLFQHLTAGYGRLELIKHLTIVRFLMRRSKDWQEFMTELNQESPRYGDTIPIDLDSEDC